MPSKPTPMFLAKSSHHTLILHGSHPRKALLFALNAKYADKIYLDKANGSTVHNGYIVKGEWFTLYNLTYWEQKA